MSCRRFLVIVFLGVVPGIANAQFTTFIPLKPCAVNVDTVKVMAAKRARADSITARALTNMKTWVDSAAGSAPAARTDTSADATQHRETRHEATRVSAPEPAPAPTRPAPEPAVPEIRFYDGSQAPATASSLPLLLFLGLAALTLGVVILKWPGGFRRGT